jgi:hypothetical protein
MARADAPPACVPGPDLTAFAHGELAPRRRAEVAGHVLRCERCRASLEESRGMLALLSLLRPASVAAGARRTSAARSMSVAPLLALGAMAAAVVVAAVSWWPRDVSAPSRTEPPVVTARASEAAWSAPEVSALLRAQAADGRWPAEADFGGSRNDEAATALALLALMPEDARVLSDGPVARAVAGAARWLLARERESGEPAIDSASLRNRAVSAAGVLGLYAVTKDESLRLPADRAVRRLARDVERSEGDRSSLTWALRALEKARGLGGARTDAAIRHLHDRLAPLGGPLPSEALVPARPVPETPVDDASACDLALRLLEARGGIARR